MAKKTASFFFYSNLVLPLVIGASQTALATDPYALSQQNVLNGASQVEATANYGTGILFGDIDTGIVQQWIGFNAPNNGLTYSNIDTKDSAQCLNGSCPTRNFPTDKDGHGTFTASEIVGGAPASGLQSMAPNAKLLAVQVLNAQGSGNSTDISNGVIYAVNHGAQVLNLSLGPGGTAAQNAAFYQSMASAVNYAASKNVYVVFAGGNSSQALAGGLNVTGFTASGIQHLLFMGSTNASLQLSTFSNTPGTGGFVASDTGAITPYANMWLMADGEDIWGASTYNTRKNGYSYIQQDSGTSMSAPQGTGAIGLLEATWPILRTNGTAAQVLEQTGTDLGTAGVDGTYGSGYLNLVAAFQPVGGTYSTTTGGGTVSITQTGATTLSGGALGSLSSVSSVLKDYTIFDSYQRNFTADLSGLVGSKAHTSTSGKQLTQLKTTTNDVFLADGSSFASGSTSDDSGHFMSFTNATGATIASGSGLPASASFADALWGHDNAIAGEQHALGASNAVTSLAEGGDFAAIGTPLGPVTRVAFSWSETQPGDARIGNDWMTPKADAFSSGIEKNISQDLKAGLTVGVLNEQHGLLGSTFSNTGPLNFGDQHQTASLGFTSAYAFGEKTDLLLDVAVARSNGATIANSLVSSVSPLYARSWGAALVRHDAIDKGDALSFSLQAPLRVYAGSAAIAVTSVDDNGIGHTASQQVSLRPNGAEMDLTGGYQAPVKDGVSWNVSATYRHDPDNTAGTHDASMLVGTKLSF